MNFKLKLKDIIYIVIIILLSIGAYKLAEHIKSKELEEKEAQIKKYKIKNDSLVQVSPGVYKKLVADTLTKSQLEKKVDSLKLELKNPKIVEVIKFEPEPIEGKEIDKVKVKDTTITIEDTYPDKEEPFITYTANVNIKTGLGKSDWNFEEQELRLGIGENKDGTYQVKTKVPEWLKITAIDIESQPMKEQEIDNFGFLFGAGYGQNLTTSEEYLNLQGGVRYKRTYLFLNAGTNNTINGTLTFEF